MKLSFAALALSFASSAVAWPALKRHYYGCLSQDDANTIVSEYAALQNHQGTAIGGPKRTAKQLLASDFSETSDSLNELIGLPLGTVTFPNKAGYIAAVLGTGAAQLSTIRVLVSSCNYITWQWQDTSAGTYPVKGFHLFQINGAKQIESSWVEFNSIAWNEDFGGSCTIPTAITASNVTRRAVY